MCIQEYAGLVNYRQTCSLPETPLTLCSVSAASTVLMQPYYTRAGVLQTREGVLWRTAAVDLMAEEKDTVFDGRPQCRVNQICGEHQLRPDMDLKYSCNNLSSETECTSGRWLLMSLSFCNIILYNKACLIRKACV